MLIVAPIVCVDSVLGPCFVIETPVDFSCCPFERNRSGVVNLVLIVAPIVCGGSVLGPCFVIEAPPPPPVTWVKAIVLVLLT